MGNSVMSRDFTNMTIKLEQEVYLLRQAHINLKANLQLSKKIKRTHHFVNLPKCNLKLIRYLALENMKLPLILKLNYTIQCGIKTKRKIHIGMYIYIIFQLAGPGQYNLSSSFSTKNSTYFGSNTKIGKQRRFNSRTNNNPPPNACILNNYSDQQQYTHRTMTEPTSKYEQSVKYSFSRREKGMGLKMGQIPGPGAYK